MLLNSKSVEERAESLKLSEVVSLLNDLEKTQDELSHAKHQADILKIQLSWYQTQLHGSKSEKLSNLSFSLDATQFPLGPNMLGARLPEKKEERIVEKHKRVVSNYKKDYPGTPEYSGLRFDVNKAEVEDVIVPAKGIEGLKEEDYEIISTKITCKITKQASYKVIRYLQDVVKIKETGKLISSPLPSTVFPGSYAETDFVVGLLVDKFKYHIPIFRQQQMIKDAGIYLCRSTLVNLVLKIGELLRPIHKELLKSIIESRIISIDEVPVRVGSSKGGGLTKSYLWPMYGDKDEVGFVYSDTRASIHIDKMLGLEFDSGKILLSDGYAAYQAYRKRVGRVTNAFCWAHVRRKFVEALKYEGELCSKALLLIGAMYGIEKSVQGLDPEKILKTRQDKSKPIVEEFFNFLEESLSTGAFLPSSPFAKACKYAFGLEEGLKIFLSEPDLSMDNNHTERAIRPVVLGRKNWLFCWSEMGAETLAIMQSLISSCVLQGVNPTQYLRDVLDKIETVPNKDIRTLIPREWARIYLPELERNKGIENSLIIQDK